MQFLKQDHLLFPEILWHHPTKKHLKDINDVVLIAASKEERFKPLLVLESIENSSAHSLFVFPESLAETYQSLIPINIQKPVIATYSGSISKQSYDEILEIISKSSVVLLGPSLSNNEESLSLLKQVYIDCDKPLVIDGENAQSLEIIQNHRNYPTVLILTKNQFAKLIVVSGEDSKKYTSQYINDYAIDLAATFSSIWKMVLVIIDIPQIIIADYQDRVVQQIGSVIPEIIEGIAASFISFNKTKVFECVATACFIAVKASDQAHQIMQKNPSPANIISFIKPIIRKLEIS